MNETGRLDQTIDQFDNLEQIRRSPPMQLIGSPERRNLDLNSLRARGVTIAAASLRSSTASANSMTTWLASTPKQIKP
jgi:hypothetical protein